MSFLVLVPILSAVSVFDSSDELSTRLAPSSTLIVNDVRVQALSSTLLRIEPLGPKGYVNSTTFTVASRQSFTGVPLRMVESNTTRVLLATDFYSVEIDTKSKSNAPPPPPAVPVPGAPNCSGYSGFALRGSAGYPPRRISSCSGQQLSCLPPGATAEDCCNNCTDAIECVAWEHSNSSCILLAETTSLHTSAGFISGGLLTPGLGAKLGIAVRVLSPDGKLLWSVDDLGAVSSQLSWPSPASSTVYAFTDFPRFYVPRWGPMPIPPEEISKAIVTSSCSEIVSTAGGRPRREFLQLTGPTPVLPDWAFGTWFTWWHQYTEPDAKSEIERWRTDDLPLDVWGLDMNWRDTCGDQRSCDGSKNREHIGAYNSSDYDHPNTKLFPDFKNPGTGWFDWLSTTGGVRTYFNDHPYPANCTILNIDRKLQSSPCHQTSATEVTYRWEGLSKWLGRGLTFWWFDANWDFSVPPPMVGYSGHGDGSSWYGLDNRVWGSHLYYTISEQYNLINSQRKHTLAPGRPLALTKYAVMNMKPNLTQLHHPAHHRFPVWWTGDNVPLEGSIESMVDSGVHGFMPYVHSDCGGDYRVVNSADDLVRWTAHCAFGTIHRFHGAAHQPWSYETIDNTTEGIIRSYLKMRYTLMPSFIAAGHQASITGGFPLVARCDLYWPEYPEATSNHQYIHLNETLVAPGYYTGSHGYEGGRGLLNQSIWIPPGEWKDVWSGQTIAGPRMLNITSMPSQMPMWHRAGGLLILASQSKLRVDEQDWSWLVLEAHLPTYEFCARQAPIKTTRTVFERRTGARTEITLTMSAGLANGTCLVSWQIGRAEDGAGRAWTIRLHMPPLASVAKVTTDGLPTQEVTTLEPVTSKQAGGFQPFGGVRSRPAPLSGCVVEVELPMAHRSRAVELLVKHTQ